MSFPDNKGYTADSLSNIGTCGKYPAFCKIYFILQKLVFLIMLIIHLFTEVNKT